MTLRTWRYAALVIVMGAGLVACGDDDGDRPPLPDAGGLDGGGGDPDGGGGGDPDGGGGHDAGTPGRTCRTPAGECDVFAEMPCAEPTHGCYLAVPDGAEDAETLCAPSSATATEGMPCDAANGCLPPFHCGPGNVCRAYCCGGLSSDCSPGQICMPYSNAAPLGFCATPAGCSVVPQDGCEAGEACVFIAADGATDCREAGPAAPGQPCGPGNFCQAGSACVTPADGTPVCAQICRRADTGGCAAGSCQGVTGFPDTHGACL